MDAVLLAQGNEITTGLTLDTNSHWLCGRLWQLGLQVRRIVAAPDRLDDLTDIIRESARLAPVVVGTGGLGPTRDDLTAEAVGRAFGRPIVLDAGALSQVEALYARYGRPMAESNRKQAMLPEGARVLENRWGTAPGFAVDTEGSTLYFLPGVPREMKPMFETWVEPDILARHSIEKPVVHTIRVIGLAESELEMMLRGVNVPGLEIGFRAALPENHVKLLFQPQVPEPVRRQTVELVRQTLGHKAYGVDSGDLAEVVGQLLVQRGETLALAESCTAGRLSAWVGGVPGASRYLLEGAVVYSNEAKIRSCGVSREMLEEHGAVSEPVARQLAEGIRARAGSTWGIGITGIAGPDGGTKEKPVGTVHLAVAGPDGTDHRRYNFPGDRDRVTKLSAAAALARLHRKLTQA